MRISPKTSLEQLERAAVRLKMLAQIAVLSVEEASDLCSVNRDRIEAALDNGELGYITIFGGRKILRAELDGWLFKNQIIRN